MRRWVVEDRRRRTSWGREVVGWVRGEAQGWEWEWEWERKWVWEGMVVKESVGEKAL